MNDHQTDISAPTANDLYDMNRTSYFTQDRLTLLHISFPGNYTIDARATLLFHMSVVQFEIFFWNSGLSLDLNIYPDE